MKPLLLGLAAVVDSSTVLAQTSPASVPDSVHSAQLTKLEAFGARVNVVQIKVFTTIGSVTGRGRVSVDVREYRDAGQQRPSIFGVSFEIKESGVSDRESVSLVDEDEIDQLIRTLDQFLRADKSATRMSDYEMYYRTRGDLVLTLLWGRSSEANFVVSSGRPPRATAGLALRETDQLKQMLLQARSAIAAAKQSK
jgi:hypothetical protein